MKRVLSLKDLITKDLKVKIIPSGFFFIRTENRVIIGKDLEGLEIVKIDNNVFVVKYISEDKCLYQFLRYDENVPLIVDNEIAPSIPEASRKIQLIFNLLNSGDIEKAKKILISLKGLFFIEDSEVL
ncbi:hypothetical protein [Acidianus manzaensis]|uniref:Uncharacterized protein n=1 Tax=Acidianus manzaensis TaxID=282676 RepID=A0A1W6JY87_9CREN|nr:hypothetical protein [Acidianus manzaensis]ARM75202.1 hypothetical protein B6F84_03575 [Acidianus manzaensis]